MKARCVRLVGIDGKPQDESAWLTVGKTYHVLEVVQDTHSRWLLRLLGDEPNGVALFPVEQFEIVTRKLSPSWVPVWDRGGSFCLTPEAWSKVGFWEHYYDHDPTALRVFDEEMLKTLAADP